MTTRTKINWSNYELLKELLGPHKLLEELMQAMSADECAANLEHIASMHDIEIEDYKND